MAHQKLTPQEMDEGAGAHVRRLFPLSGRGFVDPFVLLDEFSVKPGAGFPDHPHRGFEAITYVLDGAMHHRDNLGNDSVVSAGGVQSFTAGKGIVHSEMPEGKTTAHGIQLWVNLAKAQKNLDAAYQQVTAQEIPESKVNGCRVRTVAGPGSPVRLHTPVLCLDVELAPGGRHTTHVPTGYQGLLYVLDGEVRAQDATANQGEGLAFGEGDITVDTGPGGRYLVIAGPPHREPVNMHGSYVD